MAVLREEPEGREHSLERPRTVIGRDVACDVLVKVDVASRRHAAILHEPTGYILEDLGSVNGTFLNGERIQDRQLLKAGDAIEVAGVAFRFLETSGVRPESPPSIVASLDVVSASRIAVAPEAKLRAVLEMSRNLGATLDLDILLPKVLESLFVIFPQAHSGAVLLSSPGGGPMVPHAIRHRHEPRKGASTPFSRTVVQHAVATQRAVLSDDASRDLRFEPSTSLHSMSLRSVMCVPMVTEGGTCLGAVQLSSEDIMRPFCEEDLDVLVSAAAQAGRAIELFHWHKERRELEAATRIQKSFLPGERPQAEGLQFFDYYAAADYVGGDYYDYIPLSGNRLVVAVGDVSGKGVSAALLMARLSAGARFCLASEADLALAIRRLNGLMARAVDDDRFVTFVAVAIDMQTWQATLVNAGHLPPLRRRGQSGVIEVLADECSGLPLGVFDRPYERIQVQLEPGDTLVLFSDGVTEARNPAGELYGVERLKGILDRHGSDAEHLGQALLEDIRIFTAGTPAFDDLTLVCVGRKKN